MNRKKSSKERTINHNKELIFIGIAIVVLLMLGINKYSQKGSPIYSSTLNGNASVNTNSQTSEETKKEGTSGFIIKDANQEGWETYENLDYKLKISYPKNWEDENGKLLSKRIVGPNQVSQGEFHDGASFSLRELVITSKSLETWINDDFEDIKHADSVKIYNEIIGENTFTNVYGCGTGCFIHHFTKKDNVIYDIVTFSDGTNKEDQDKILQRILASFQLY